MNARVFAVLHGFPKEHGLEGKKGVRFVRHFNEFRTQIECSINPEDYTESLNGEKLYQPVPVVEIPSSAKRFWYELQLVERGERNKGIVVTDRTGKKLAPRWSDEKSRIAGFKTVHGELVSVEVGTLQGIGMVYAYRLAFEGTQCFLTEKLIGSFRVVGTTIERGVDTDNIKWTGDTFFLDNSEMSPEEEEQVDRDFTEAARAAVIRGSHNCLAKKCKPHYALSDEEAKAHQDRINAQKREKREKEENRRRDATKLKEVPAPAVSSSVESTPLPKEEKKARKPRGKKREGGEAAQANAA